MGLQLSEVPYATNGTLKRANQLIREMKHGSERFQCVGTRYPDNLYSGLPGKAMELQSNQPRTGEDLVFQWANSQEGRLRCDDLKAFKLARTVMQAVTSTSLRWVYGHAQPGKGLAKLQFFARGDH